MTGLASKSNNFSPFTVFFKNQMSLEQKNTFFSPSFILSWVSSLTHPLLTELDHVRGWREQTLLNQIQLRISLVHSAEWIFSSFISSCCGVQTWKCRVSLLSWVDTAVVTICLHANQHRPVVFDASNHPTGGLDTNHPWILSHPAWRHISAMADATYRAPSALHFISFLNLLSCSLTQKKTNLFYSLS